MRRRIFLRGLLGVAAIPYVGLPTLPAPAPEIIKSIPYKLGNYTLWIRPNHVGIMRNLAGKNKILDDLRPETQ